MRAERRGGPETAELLNRRTLNLDNSRIFRSNVQTADDADDAEKERELNAKTPRSKDARGFNHRIGFPSPPPGRCPKWSNRFAERGRGKLMKL